jgi:hypothetical protein
MASNEALAPGGGAPRPAPTGSGRRRLTANDRAAYSPISDYNLFQPSAEAQQLGAAVERWRRRHGRQPDWAEVLAVARQLGWRKAAGAGEGPEGGRPDRA